MQIFLIGHRGTGKTSLLQRLQIYSGGTLKVFDLDREIEKSSSRTVAEIFQEQGEDFFRKQEHSTLDRLISKNSKMICSLGAGFPLDNYVFPVDSEIVWIRRSTDSDARVFIDRPRLDATTSAKEEYLNRFAKREQTYLKHCDWIYTLAEGLSSPCQFEKSIWGMRLDDCGGYLTLNLIHFRSKKVFATRTRHIGVDFFEIRNDLLTEQEINFACEKIPPHKLLFSFRNWPASAYFIEKAKAASAVDWALELGDISKDLLTHVTVVSSHDASIPPAFSEYEGMGRHLKWSPLIEKFQDLKAGLDWQKKSPTTRSFLPRSSSGKWQWIRQILKSMQKINFWQEGLGSAADQPTLHQWISTLPVQSFGAVLGSPITHSYSPVEHLNYAHHRQKNFFSIEVSEKEWDIAWPILQDLDLSFAAVTSPLKTKAFAACNENSDLSKKYGSVNTLTKIQDGWRGHNTDCLGLKEVLQDFEIDLYKKPIVYGGGGTLPVLKDLFPEACFFSVRSQNFRDLNSTGETQENDFDILIWAAGPNDKIPENLSFVNLKVILDLNYVESSQARSLAVQIGCRYISGLPMFRAQAEAQRKEWENELK